MANRPTLLSIIAVLLVLYSIFVLSFGLSLIFLSNDIVKIVADMGLETDWLTSAMGVFSVAMCIVVLALVYFLWKGVRIGWYFALILLTVYGILGAITFFPYGLALTAVMIIFIWYFLRPNVREFFGT